MANIAQPPAYDSLRQQCPTDSVSPSPASSPVAHNNPDTSSSNVDSQRVQADKNSSSVPRHLAGYSFFDPSNDLSVPSRRNSTASSQLPSYSAKQPSYGPGGIYATEDEYLDALRKFVDKRKYHRPAKAGLVGFYSTTTADDYINQPRPSFGRKKKFKRPQIDAGSAECTHENDNGRYASGLNSLELSDQGQHEAISTPDDASSNGRPNTSSATEKPRRKGSLAQWIQRRRTSSGS